MKFPIYILTWQTKDMPDIYNRFATFSTGEEVKMLNYMWSLIENKNNKNFSFTTLGE